MKLARKARQKKRKAFAQERQNRREEKSEQKSFAAVMLAQSKKGVPHCEWNGSAFVPTRPKPSPRMDVNASIMHVVHEKFGSRWTGSRKGAYASRKANGITDSGCQPVQTFLSK